METSTQLLARQEELLQAAASTAACWQAAKALGQTPHESVAMPVLMRVLKALQEQMQVRSALHARSWCCFTGCLHASKMQMMAGSVSLPTIVCSMCSVSGEH